MEIKMLIKKIGVLLICVAFLSGDISAAILATMNWYVRSGAGVSELNGGGFDGTISGAGTNYADQDSPQLSLTDLTSTNSTTVTTILGTFTSAMVGNVLRLASGAGTVPDYYTINAFVSAGQVTLDRVSGTYTAGVARVGGAHASLVNMQNGGSCTAPALASPLLPGNTVYVRGAGSDDPTSADYTQTCYRQFPAGDATNGLINFVGYNGRPRFDSDALAMYNLAYIQFSHMKFVMQNANNGTLGTLYGTTAVRIVDIYIDQNGNDAVGAYAVYVANNRFTNSGSASAGTTTNSAIYLSGYPSHAHGNYINGWRGDGVYQPGGGDAIVSNNIIVNCKKNGIETPASTDSYFTQYANNTIAKNSLDGILLSSVYASISIINNTITANGGYGLNLSAGSSALNNALHTGVFDYNNYGTGADAYGGVNASGAVNGVNRGGHDQSLDPTFTNAAGGDFSIGTNLKALGTPNYMPPNSLTATTTSYTDIGAVQRKEAGGASTTYIFNVIE